MSDEKNTNFNVSFSDLVISSKVQEKAYDDAKPVVKQVVKASETLAACINKKLESLRRWAMESEENTKKLEEMVIEELALISEEDIDDPDKRIAVPALRSNSYTDSDKLRRAYAKLIAKTMDKSQKNRAHPSFVKIIDELSPEEALFLKTSNILNGVPSCAVVLQEKEDTDTKSFFGPAEKGYNVHPNHIFKRRGVGLELLKHYIPGQTIPPEEVLLMVENFLRLNLITHGGFVYKDPDSYVNFYFDKNMEKIEKNVVCPLKEKEPRYENYELAHIMSAIQPTAFGRQFYQICIE